MLRRLTIERTTIFILFMLVFALASRVPVDTDTWWHLRSGDYMLNTGFITTDPFSYTMQGAPWINHSWGAQIILYGFWQLGGMTGLVIYMAGLATLGMFFIYRMCEGNVYLRAFVIIIGAATAAVFWSPRPQMLSFLCSTIALYLLFSFKYRQKDRLWLYPVLMAIWGNLHAGFAIGFILLGGMIAGEIIDKVLNPSSSVLTWGQIQKLILVGIVSVAALVINPYGVQILTVPFQTIGIGALRNFIQEWNSPNFQGRETWPFVFMVIALLGAVGASKRRLDWTSFVLVSGTIFMALLAGRNISVFAVVATPVLTFHLYDVLTQRGWAFQPMRRTTTRMAVINLLLLGLILFASIIKTASVVLPTIVQTTMESALPVKAVTYIREAQLQGAQFNSYNWGGYLVYALREHPVFVDGRTDLYGDEFLTQYLQTAIGGDGWRETLEQYDIQWVLIETNSGLARRLRDEANWRTAYEDDLAVVFVREA